MSNKIGDNDIRAKQSLELCKNWLAKHPFLKYTGDDDIDDVIMAYLRIKKFSMQKAYESFEFTIPFMKLHSDWYANPGPADYEFTDKPNSPLIFLKNPDAEGRRIHIQRYKYFDDFEDDEFFRRIVLTPLLPAFDMAAQLNGVVAIFDYRDVNMGKMRKIPLHLIQESIRASKSGLVKLKQMNIIGLPAFFRPIFEIAKTFTTAKILERVNLIDDVEELAQHMDVSLLPKEYGGSANEFLDYEVFKNGIDYVNKLSQFDVNFNKIQERENVGSFRKLEID
ncbi:alpha-tocopherol transfer protein-like [Chironomus tepperi]|uniref:alpha-tocopherol transfer protein-like n=1 Tax=Chironomus tepperi TaxID=113505 RepID=UPI00391EE4FE